MNKLEYFRKWMKTVVFLLAYNYFQLKSLGLQLNLFNVEPKEIKKTELKQDRYEDEVKYILYLKPNTVTMRDLRDI